jgi:hypothetical protein
MADIAGSGIYLSKWPHVARGWLECEVWARTGAHTTARR